MLPFPLRILSLLSVEGFGPARYWQLVEKLASDTFDFDDPVLTAQIPDHRFMALHRAWHHPSGIVMRAWERYEAMGIVALTPRDDRYPTLLRELRRGPPVLFIQGNVEAFSRPQIAMVGSRAASVAGCDIARHLAKDLSDLGVLVTSGLAQGIDAAAHQGALAGTTGTVAVVGTGLDRVYPRKHQALAERILDLGGAIVSEFPAGSAPRPEHFPRRNRVISGLSLGVVVVEATPKSGSLITARFALEQNREVMAVPGPARGAKHQGCHQLIKAGAHLVEDATDIVRCLGDQLPCEPTQLNTSSRHTGLPELSPEERQLVEALEPGPCDLDVLLSRLPAAFSACTADVLSHLTSLELLGLVSQEGAQYTLRRTY